MNQEKKWIEDNLLREEPEFKLGDVWIQNLKKMTKLKQYRRTIVFIGIVVSLLAGSFSLLKSVTYTGRVNFVIEENKQTSGGLFSALAGQVGLDMSSLSGNSGILAGDNILELLKSPTLLKKVLLSSDPEDTTRSLAWVYTTSNGYAKKFLAKAGKKEIFLPTSTPMQAGLRTRVEDSLLQIINKRIIEKELSVYKPDKKLSIFSLELTTKNERITQLISLRLLDQVSKLYIDTKTRRLRNNVDRLQHKADSVSRLLNQRTYTSISKDLINANPSFINTEADLEISRRDKSLLSLIYSDLNKSLDISKTALIQETPTIEVIDSPELPLKKNEWKWYVFFPAGFILGILISAFLVIYFMPSAKKITS
jgi:hypothetical protein